MKKISALAAVLALSLAGVASAQDFWLTGQVTNPNWSPSTGVPIGGGVADDVKFVDVGGGLWQVTLTPAQHGLTAGTRYEYKAASAGFSPVDEPGSGGNAWLVGPASGNLVVSLRATPYGDGFSPEAGTGPENGYLYNNTIAQVAAVAPIQVVGNFVDELGGAEWTIGDANNPILLDNYNTTTGDNIYGAKFKPAGGWAVGTKEFKILLNATYDTAIGVEGATVNAGNLTAPIVDSAQELEIILDANTGRYDINVLGGASIPAGYYAQSTAWSTGFTSAELLAETTTGSNVFQKVFTVATPGTYAALVYDENVAKWPSGDGYPFTTTIANQEVLVTFDRNTYNDGFLPAADIVTVLNNNPRTSLNSFDEVQAVGAWQGEYGLGTTSGGDWLPNDDFFNLTETATPGIWAKTFATNSANAGGSGGFKIVARRTGLTDGDYDIQIGQRGLVDDGPGANPDLPISFGTGALSFTADMVMGRASYAPVASQPVPFRPSYAPNASPTTTNAQSWTLFN